MHVYAIVSHSLHIRKYATYLLKPLSIIHIFQKCNQLRIQNGVQDFEDDKVKQNISGEYWAKMCPNSF